MAALIGALRVSLSADTAKFEQGMKRAVGTSNTAASSIKKSFGGLGAAIKGGLAGIAAGLTVGLFTNVTKGALDYAGSLGEMSQQIGVTTKDLQVLRYAAGQNGVAQDELDKGLSKLTITLGQVAARAAAPAKALNAIGIEAKDLAGLDTGAAFRKIADGLATIPDRAQRAAVEVALFGRTGAKLDTLLSGGSGAINELALAAEKLGIVLSDEQIQSADATADKLDALKTVLSAQIAGAVANNADSILALAESFVTLVGTIGRAISAYRSWRDEVDAGFNARVNDMLGNQAAAAAARGSNFKSGVNPTIPGSSVTIALGAAKPMKPVRTGGNIKQFLGGGGGAKKSRGGGGGSDNAERLREEADRRAFQFSQDEMRAENDILRAKQSLATDNIARRDLALQMLDLDKKAYTAQLAYDVKEKDKTKPQADALMALYNIKDGLERQALEQEVQEDRQRDYNMLEAKDYEIKKGLLEKQAGLAETASERRAVELQILELAYREQRERLQRIISESKDWAEIEAARRELIALGKNQSLDRQGVMQSTQGPMEGYLSSLPGTADKMNEALQGVAVNGLQSLEDGILSVIDGTKSLGDAFKDMAKSIIADLIRIQIQKMIVNLIGSISGAPGAGMSLPGFATGGSFTVMGKHGRDQNVMSIGGLPIAKVSRGERVSVSNDNSSPRGGAPFTFNNYARMSGTEARQTGMQAAAGYRTEMNRATSKGL